MTSRPQRGVTRRNAAPGKAFATTPGDDRPKSPMASPIVPYDARDVIEVFVPGQERQFMLARNCGDPHVVFRNGATLGAKFVLETAILVRGSLVARQDRDGITECDNLLHVVVHLGRVTGAVE